MESLTLDTLVVLHLKEGEVSSINLDDTLSYPHVRFRFSIFFLCSLNRVSHKENQDQIHQEKREKFKREYVANLLFKIVFR